MKKTTLLFAGMACAFSVVAADKPVEANNTGINERDRASPTLTADEQSQSKPDVVLDAKIRRAVLDQPGISMDGQNIKIIAQNGHVTLRGPVTDEAERIAIGKTVKKAAGKAKVDNQLEVK